MTLWGVPGEASHNRSRGWECLDDIEGPTRMRVADRGAEPKPVPDASRLVPDPAALAVLADSWREPGNRNPDGTVEGRSEDPRWKQGTPNLSDASGLRTLPFTPSISVEPETSSGSTPSGMNVDVHLPQRRN